jgi:peptidoglycan/xylan/chitin deacetylase (PgdA/CDA1 family)
VEPLEPDTFLGQAVHIRCADLRVVVKPDIPVALAPAPAVKTVTTADQPVTEGPAQPTSTLVVHQVIAAAPAEAPLQPAAASAQFALTFNGAPDASLLPGILGALKQYGMHATFFVTGQAAQERPDLVAQIVAAGHEVADGGLSGEAMATLGPRDAKAQLQKAQAAIAKAAGKAPSYFRPPMGAMSQPLADAATALGMQTVLWTNVGVTDDPAADPAQLANRLLDAVYPGSVLMLHQDRPVAATVLDDHLKALAGRSMQSVTLSELHRS